MVLASSPTTGPPKLPVHRLSPEELVVHWDCSLCYHCDNKWVTTHWCKPHLHLFIIDDDSKLQPSLASPDFPTTLSDIVADNPPLLSLHGMLGMPTPTSLHWTNVLQVIYIDVLPCSNDMCT
ncbi:hypothetical protein GmHk_20G057846 [Glycine max]|nr:hypothetical protein GmHk_20G057846 [Glycine max]